MMLAIHLPKGASMRTVLILALAAFTAMPALAQSPDELLKKNGCTACHAVDKKVIGPAYNDVSAKYKGDAGAAARLMDKVKKGGVGVWGQVPMPPNPQVSDAENKAMIGYILALKK
jgi:cytochrome c